MNHLTLQEITRLVDDEIGGAEAGRMRGHLSDCDRCRREFRFQQALARTAREMPLPQLSESALRNVVPKLRTSQARMWIAKVVDNLGNVIAMTLVLTAIGYLTIRFSPQQTTDEPSQLSVVRQGVGYVGQQITKLLSPSQWPILKKGRETVYAPAGPHSGKMYALVAISILALIGLDVIVQRRFKRLSS